MHRERSEGGESRGRYESWETLKATLQKRDFDRFEDELYVNRHGWFRIASFLGLSFEIKDAERRESDGSRVVWRYRVRVSGERGFAEAEGVASSDEFPEKRTDNFLSYIAQVRAYTRAISFLVGSGDLAAEEFITTIAKARPETSEVTETSETKEQKTLTEEQKLEELIIQEVQEDERDQIKLSPTKRSEIFNQIKELMTVIGLKTPEERKKYASEVLGRDIGRGVSITDAELLTILKRLKADAMRKKTISE